MKATTRLQTDGIRAIYLVAPLLHGAARECVIAQRVTQAARPL